MEHWPPTTIELLCPTSLVVTCALTLCLILQCALFMDGFPMAIHVLENWLWHLLSMVIGPMLGATLMRIPCEISCMCKVQPLVRMQQSRTTRAGVLLLLHLVGSLW